jgi:hypothetical protein
LLFRPPVPRHPESRCELAVESGGWVMRLSGGWVVRIVQGW